MRPKWGLGMGDSSWFLVLSSWFLVLGAQARVRRPEWPKGQYVPFILPLQGNGIWGAGTQGGAALCPGLYHESPLG